MGVLEALLLILGGAAGFFGYLYKQQVKKNAVLEVEKKAHEKTAEMAVKAQDAFILSEREERETVNEIIEKSREAAEHEQINTQNSNGRNLSKLINFMHKKSSRK